MKITGIRVHVLEWDRGPFHWRDGLPPRGRKGSEVFLRILTDEGLEGCSLHLTDPAITEVLKWKLVGRDPIDREAVWQDMWKNLRGTTLGYAMGAVDVALWDLLGKVTNLPAWKLLGGTKDRVLAYASTLTLDSIQEYLDLAEDCLARGYKAIKLHAWGRLDQDADLFRALRKAVGNDIVLMYDASSMFNYEDALRIGRVLEEEGFYWYEEPMDHFNITVLSRLAPELDIPLAVAEAHYGGAFNALDHIMAGAADIIITDPLMPYKGGFTGVMKTAHICEGFGLMCALHGWDIACLHAACAVPSCRYFEMLMPEGFLLPPGIRVASTTIGGDGYVTPWDKPGLGMDIDWKWVDEHTVQVLE